MDDENAADFLNVGSLCCVIYDYDHTKPFGCGFDFQATEPSGDLPHGVDLELSKEFDTVSPTSTFQERLCAGPTDRPSLT